VCRGSSCIPSSGSELSESSSYQQVIAEVDIIVTDTFLHDSSIEKEILVVTKMPFSPLVYFSLEGVLERVLRVFSERAIA